MSRITYLNRPQLIALDIACAPLDQAFEEGVYLVGSCITRADYRDVDVRVLLSGKEWRGMFGELDPSAPWLSARWEITCIAFSKLIGDQTSLPVELQFQEVDAANTDHSGKRIALGVRGLGASRYRNV